MKVYNFLMNAYSILFSFESIAIKCISCTFVSSYKVILLLPNIAMPIISYTHSVLMFRNMVKICFVFMHLWSVL